MCKECYELKKKNAAMRATMLSVLESLRLFYNEAGCQTHVRDAIRELEHSLSEKGVK